jgi:GT2 family glycosyltransferase
VVDNASVGDDVRVLREKFGEYVHLISNDKNYGFAEGNNIGIRYALSKGMDYVLLLNNDTTVAPDFLDEMVRVGESDGRIGIVGPKMYFYDRPNVIWQVGAKINWWLGAIRILAEGQADVGQYGMVAERDLLSGAALLIRAKLLERISLLDSSFFFGCEDYDFCIRAWKAGFKVVCVPSARIWHKGRRSKAKLPSYPEAHRRVRKDAGILGLRLRYKLFRKHSRMPPFPMLLILHCLIYWPIRVAELAFGKVAPFLSSSSHSKKD